MAVLQRIAENCLGFAKLHSQNPLGTTYLFTAHYCLIDGENVFGFGWTAYYNLDEIYNWIDEQLVAYPQILTNLTVDYAYQGRAIRAVRLSHRSVRFSACGFVHVGEEK